MSKVGNQWDIQMEDGPGAGSESQWRRRTSVRRLACTECLKWGGTFAWSRERLALNRLLESGKGEKKIPPGLKQQCKPNTGFRSPNGVRDVCTRNDAIAAQSRESANVSKVEHPHGAC